MESIVTLFVVSAPKFISPATDYDAMPASRASAKGGVPRPAGAAVYGGLQRIVFGEEVRQMLELRKLRDYLKLYSTIGLAKLSAFTVRKKGGGWRRGRYRRRLNTSPHRPTTQPAKTNTPSTPQTQEGRKDS